MTLVTLLENLEQKSPVRAALFLDNYGKPEQNIDNQVSSQRLQQVARNRQLLIVVIEILKLCAVQNIPLRGHRNDGPLGQILINDTNDGNFRHLLRLKISCSEDLKKIFEEADGVAKYTSKTIRN